MVKEHREMEDAMGCERCRPQIVELVWYLSRLLGLGEWITCLDLEEI